MKVHVIKIALHTVGRIGFSAAMFFLVGLYLIFPAATSFLAMQEDKKEDFEITASATKTVDLEELKGIKGVKKLSPAIKFNGKIAYGEYVLETEIDGIMGTYLEGEKIDGTIFPDGSNMPYLILNEAALKAFKDSDGKSPGNVDINGSFSLLLENESPAILCGVLSDGAETPKVYMNYDAAKSLAGFQEQYQIRFQLFSAGYGNKVTRELKTYGLEVQNEYERIEQWEAAERSIMQQCVSSLGFLICALLLTQKNYTLEKIQRREEIKNLRLSGLSMKELHCILRLRLAIMLVLCIAVACIAAWWTSNMSSLALLIAIIVSGICLLLLSFSFSKKAHGKGYEAT